MLGVSGLRMNDFKSGQFSWALYQDNNMTWDDAWIITGMLIQQQLDQKEKDLDAVVKMIVDHAEPYIQARFREKSVRFRRRRICGK